jgi:hypothetical protein
MALKTSNFGLIKPELMDTADITAFNENWDKIDEQLLKAGESGGSDLVQTELGTEIGTGGGSEIEGEEPTVDPATETIIKVIINETFEENNVLIKSAVVDNLESESTDLPLSANQGRVLNEKIPTFSLSGTTLTITL